MEAMISKAEHDAIVLEKQGQINALKHRLQQLERLFFGAKSERYIPATAPEQMTLFEQGAQPDTEPVEKQKITYERSKKKKPHPGRLPLPDHRLIILRSGA